jgi:DNA-directed RNA polymerase specialized sigma24 family protein
METSAELANLLLWLGPDAASGARRYVELRQKLTTLFAFRGCEAVEELADETMDRAARAILKPGFSFEGNPIAYLRGVARNVHLESLRRNRTVSQEVLPELADCVAQASSGTSQIEQLHECLDRCLARLPSDKRSLLLRYYRGERSAKIDGRLQLAQEEGVEVTTLRIQVFRLRKSVRRCVEGCTKAKEMEPGF